MASVQAPAVFRSNRTVFSVPVNHPLSTKLGRSGFFSGLRLREANVGYDRRCRSRKRTSVHCSFSSSSDGGGRTAGNFNEGDADYVNSSVVEAVEIRSDTDGFTIKMRDGRHLRCVHNNPKVGHEHVPDHDAPHPAIVLKMEDGTGLLLPIIVLEMPSVLLMAAVRNVPIARPTMYQVFKDMIEKMGYSVRIARVTKKVGEAYVAELDLVKVDNEADCFSFELRPSDAINIAVRCKVNKLLAYSDGMRVIESSKVPIHIPFFDGQLFSQLDRPTGQPCIETKEFDLVRNMLVAAIEERYRDAASWRDKLTQFRSKGKWT